MTFICKSGDNGAFRFLKETSCVPFVEKINKKEQYPQNNNDQQKFAILLNMQYKFLRIHQKCSDMS